MDLFIYERKQKQYRTNSNNDRYFTFEKYNLNRVEFVFED